MPSVDDAGKDGDGAEPAPLALGTRNGVVKRWNRESPTTMDSWNVIDLKDGDEVLAAAEARDGDRLVFVSTDSSLLTFEAKNVRPQGRTAGGMAGIRLATGCWFRPKRSLGRMTKARMVCSPLPAPWC